MLRYLEEFICLLAFQFKFKIIGYFKTPKLYNPENDHGSLWSYLVKARHELGTGNLTAAVETWPVVSRKVATASALVKSETIFLFSSILYRRLCWLSMAQYLKPSNWIFIFILSMAEWNGRVHVHVWLFVVPFCVINLPCNYQEPRSGIRPFGIIYFSEGLSNI